MALTGMAVMAALALAKNQMIDQPQADRKRKYEANTAALSPWTGLKSEYVQDPNAIGAMIGGAGAGAAMGSEISKSNLNDSLAGNPAISGVEAAPDYSGKLGEQATGFNSEMNSSLDSSMHPVTSKMNSWDGVNAGEKSPGWNKMAAPGDAYYIPGGPDDPKVKNKAAAWDITPNSFKANY